MEKYEKLLELCRPVVEHLQAEENPYTEIHIKADGIKQMTVEIAVPIKEGD